MDLEAAERNALADVLICEVILQECAEKQADAFDAWQACEDPRLHKGLEYVKAAKHRSALFKKYMEAAEKVTEAYWVLSKTHKEYEGILEAYQAWKAENNARPT